MYISVQNEEKAPLTINPSKNRWIALGGREVPIMTTDNR